MSLTTQETERQWAREQIENIVWFIPGMPNWQRSCKQVLEAATKEHAPLAIVQTRPKAVASFAEKAQRKKNRYRDPLNRMTDLCGGRVITHTHTEVEAVCKFIEAHFQIDRDNSVDVSQRLKPTEFGYRSVHYIVHSNAGFSQPERSTSRFQMKFRRIRIAQ